MIIPEIEPVELPWRTVPEWVGKNADSKVPTKVKQRVFLRWGGRCHLTGVKIKLTDKWDVEHVKPVRSALPGEPHLNRESNLRPALKAPHREKTAKENTDGAKADRIHAKHHGYWPETKAKIKGRGFERSRKAPTVQQALSRWSGGEADCETNTNTSPVQKAPQ